MRVLMAVDLHDQAEAVIGMARSWVTRMSSTVDLVFVTTWAASGLHVEEPAIRAVLDQQYEEARRDSQARLEKALGLLPEANRGQALVVDGTPGQTIAALSEKYEAVIVGTHGRTGLNHLFLGSVAERVVRTSPVPVLVLKLKGTVG